MYKISKLGPVAGLAEQLADVHQDGFSHPWDTPSFDALLTQPGISVWGAISIDQQELIGFAMVRAASVELDIITIAVRGPHRRKGAAEALLAAIFREVEATCEAVFLEVDPQNTAAFRLYAKLGFETVGERPKYYKYADGTVGDAILMSCKLGSS